MNISLDIIVTLVTVFMVLILVNLFLLVLIVCRHCSLSIWIPQNSLNLKPAALDTPQIDTNTIRDFLRYDCLSVSQYGESISNKSNVNATKLFNFRGLTAM